MNTRQLNPRAEQIGDNLEEIVGGLQDFPPDHPEDDPIRIADASLAGKRGKR